MYVNHSVWCVILSVLYTALIAGCIAGSSSDVAYLMQMDYVRMTDAELVSYEQELSDELVKSSRSSNRDVGVGIGFGSWGSNVGVGVHTDKWIGGGESQMTRELRERRIVVREEMRRRGLLAE